MDGTLRFKARVAVPPGSIPFIKKLHLDGDFGIDRATFTNPDVQGKVNELSKRAQGDKHKEDVEAVTSNLGGHVILNNGTARFSDLSVRVPGASVLLAGTYSLLNLRINLQGPMKMDRHSLRRLPGSSPCS
jgi:hypothetical protein